MLLRLYLTVISLAFLTLASRQALFNTAEAAPREYQVFSPEQLTAKITDVIKRESGIEQEDLASVTVPRLSPIRSPKSAKLAISVAGEMRGGRLPVELDLIDNERTLRRQRVFVTIDLYTSAWTLHRDMNPGDTITRADLREDRVGSKKVQRDVIKDPQVAIGSKLKRSLKAGSPVRRRDLSIPKLIKRGAIVSLVFHKAGISLSAEGEALGDGQRGDIVRVKNLKSKKIVTGRVIGVNKIDVSR